MKGWRGGGGRPELGGEAGERTARKEERRGKRRASAGKRCFGRHRAWPPAYGPRRPMSATGERSRRKHNTVAAPVGRSRPCRWLPSQLMSLAFDIDGRVHEFSEPLAELLAENLHNFSLGPSHRYYCDVEMLARAGIDPSWTEGARAMVNIIEDTLVGCHEGPIPLDPRGKSATALLCAVGLTGPASFNARSEHARLANTLRDAGAR